MLTLKEETTLTSEFNQLNISFVSPTFSHSDTRCEYYDLDSDEEDDSDSSSYNYIVQATTRNFHQPFENKYLFMFRTAISCSMFPWFLWNIPGSRQKSRIKFPFQFPYLLLLLSLHIVCYTYLLGVLLLSIIPQLKIKLCICSLITKLERDGETCYLVLRRLPVELRESFVLRFLCNQASS